jgi:hypothetical protein
MLLTIWNVKFTYSKNPIPTSQETYCVSITKTNKLKLFKGRAVAQADSHWLPNVAARVRVRVGMWSLWWMKWHWGRFPSEYFGSPANHHSTNFSILIITRGRHNRPIGGSSAERTQLDCTRQCYLGNYRIIVNTVQCDSICKYLLPLHVSVSWPSSEGLISTCSETAITWFVIHTGKFLY